MQTKVENIVKIPSHFLFYDLKLTGIDPKTLLTDMSPENQVQFLTRRQTCTADFFSSSNLLFSLWFLHMAFPFLTGPDLAEKTEIEIANLMLWTSPTSILDG